MLIKLDQDKWEIGVEQHIEEQILEEKLNERSEESIETTNTEDTKEGKIC